jgi:hypothetical protein
VQTFVGSEFSGYIDGQGTQTMFHNPTYVVVDTSGNLFITDVGNARIRKVSPGGAVSTFAGGGTEALPAFGTNTSLLNYVGFPMTIDRSNVIWMVGATLLYRIQPDSFISSITLPTFTASEGICADSKNNIYWSDYANHKIYRYGTNGTIEVFVGSGNVGHTDGNGFFTSFTYPRAITCDSADNIYVYESDLIRRIRPNRDVETIAGLGGGVKDGAGMLNIGFSNGRSMCSDGGGNIFLVCDTSIRKLSPTTNSSTIAGSFSQAGYANGPGSSSRFNGATGICIYGGTIFIADQLNQRIRSIISNPVEQQVANADLELETYPGLRISGVVGRSYRIESSHNMATWITETTVLLTRTPFLWFDESPIDGKKFYRAVLLP